jgi:hypothetical protein
MKLMVPQMGAPEGVDLRLTRLAEFLGLTWEPLRLEQRTQGHAEYLDKAILNRDICLVVNARLMEEWTGGYFSPDLAMCMVSRIPHLLVHGLTPDAFSDGLIQALSAGGLRSVRPLADSGQHYDIAPGARDVCGHFSGISFGPVNRANDGVLSLGPCNGAVRQLIGVGGSAFMAALKRQNAGIFFLAGADVLDMDAPVGDAPLSEYFSRFVPYAMALRRIFGEECWHPGGAYASLTIDDPLLQPKYGHLDFASLLQMMKEHNFSTTVAFIPHNYRRHSKRTVEMFRQNSDRLAICFHGNDHTEGEFGSQDTSWLNTIIGIAETRMRALTRATGIPCHKVMAFPKETYSLETMKVLKSHNFCAAVSSRPHLHQRRVTLTLRERALPAVLRHGDFPLFLRKYAHDSTELNIAFRLFFGQPALTVDHHGAFRQPEGLIRVVRMINSIAPEIRWTDLETAVMNSTLRRQMHDGTCHVRAYSNGVNIVNKGDSPQRCLVEWYHSPECPPVEAVLQDGTPIHSFEVDDGAIWFSTELAPRSSQVFSVTYRNTYPCLEGLGWQWRTKAFVRRRLSEVRDNYISKSPQALKLADALKRRAMGSARIAMGR